MSYAGASHDVCHTSQKIFRHFAQKISLPRTFLNEYSASTLSSPFGNCVVQDNPRSNIIDWQFKQRPYADDEDLRLVRQLQDGNPDALTSLFNKYSGSVFALARRMLRNSAEAEEVVQQVFLDTYRSIHQFDPQKAAYKTWLYQSAYYRALNRKSHLESKGFYTNVEMDEQELMGELYEGAGRFMQQLSPQETVQLVKQLLRSKSIQKKQRVAILLTFFHGFTAEEIAAHTGETPAAVRHHLYRGLSKLRLALLERTKHKAEEAKTKTERMLVVDPAQLL